MADQIKEFPGGQVDTSQPLDLKDAKSKALESPKDTTNLTEEMRYRIQKKRAIWAVVIMAVISAVLIGSVQLMYFFANESSEISNEDFTGSVAQKTNEKLADLWDDSPTDPFYVLLIGSDSRKGTALYTGKPDGHAQLDQHADVITLLRVDPTNYVLTFVTVPRDTILDGDTEKINNYLVDGDPIKEVEAVEKLTGVSIDYYMMTKFIGFEDLVDGISGVDAPVPVDLSLKDPLTDQKVTLKKSGSSETLNGSQALVLARARQEYKDKQDAYRQLNVRRLEVSIVRKLLATYSVQQIDQLVALLDQNVETNMDHAFVAQLAKRFIDNKELVTYYSGTGPYEGSINEQDLWAIPQDKEQWGTVVATVDAGGDPSNVIEQVKFSDLE